MQSLCHVQMLYMQYGGFFLVFVQKLGLNFWNLDFWIFQIFSFNLLFCVHDEDGSGSAKEQSRAFQVQGL